MATIQLAHNAVVAKLVNPPEEIANLVGDLLSYRVDGADQMFSVNSGQWDGRSSFYNYSGDTFPAGFAFMVQDELTRRGHTVRLIRKPHAEPLGPPSPIVDEFGNDDPRYDFHLHALRQVEKHGRGIVQVATGGGKSKIAKLIMKRWNRMTLFLTTRGILMYQMGEQLEAIGDIPGQVGDSVFKPRRGINLGMVQTLVAALKEPDLDAELLEVVKAHEKKLVQVAKKAEKTGLSKAQAKAYAEQTAGITDEQAQALVKARFSEKAKKRKMFLKLLEMIEVVIGEEAHEAGGSSYYEILRHCTKATIRVALTATPFMRDSAEDNMRLMAAFGPILIQVPEKLLIDRGILAKPYFKFVESAPHPKLHRTSPFERAYQLGYVENDAMHADIIRDALCARQVGLPTLTLISRIQHGKTLIDKLLAAGQRVEFLKGEDDQDVRKAQLRRLASGELDQLIGTTILDVGVDVPAIGLVQLAGGMKAEVSLRQRVGRGLRAKKGMANVAFIADYTSAKNQTLRDHTKQRRAIIESTPGFVEGILPDGQDFDWSIFARKAA